MNIAKHASAKSAEVSVEARDSMFTAMVTDHGVGYRGDAGGGRGVDNLRTRAIRLDGDFEITEVDGGGTLLAWRVPLHSENDGLTFIALRRSPPNGGTTITEPVWVAVRWSPDTRDRQRM